MSHDHSHEIRSYNRAFALGVVLNTAFVVIEAVYGLLADSLALLADAGHNLSDVASLLLAWGASVLATRQASDKRTYGFRKATVMASLVSALLLLTVLGGIAWEAVGRFFEPRPVAGATVMVVAAIGVVINTATALLFIKDQKHDLNIRGAFLHMAADAGVSLGVVVAGALVMYLGWVWIDPVMSLLIVAVVLISSWALLRESLNYAMDVVPSHIDLHAVRRYLMSHQRVNKIHDLHIWPLSTTEVALTAHLVVDDDILDNAFLGQVQQELHDHYGIHHATIQVEAAGSEALCMLDRDVRT